MLILAKAKIEEIEPSVSNPKYDEDLTISCVGSGNERDLAWSKDGEELPEGDFEDEVFTIIDGDYSYGQKKALRSSHKWKKPSDGATCATVARHNGQYTCHVEAQAGGETTQDTGSLTITVQCEYYQRVCFVTLIHGHYKTE